MTKRNDNAAEFQQEKTGRKLIQFRDGMKSKTIIRKIEDITGRETIVSSDYSEGDSTALFDLDEKHAFLFEDLGLTVLDKVDEENDIISALTKERGTVIRDEYYTYPMSSLSYEQRYKNWVREGLNLLAEQIDISSIDSGISQYTPNNIRIREHLWNLEKTEVINSPYSGEGIKIAILDSGIAPHHKDFNNREIEAHCFLENKSQTIDKSGHGTHCAGIAWGPETPVSDQIPRYGIAHGADLYAGKVLDNLARSDGKIISRGREAELFDGIRAAIDAGCHIISLSLGLRNPSNRTNILTYEKLAKLALSNDCLIIAATGNDSNRMEGIVEQVSLPASAEGILSVGAVDQDLSIADFSNGREDEVDIYAPGVKIFSAVLDSQYKHLDGTSMAAPHVAGIAALFAQSDSSLRGSKLAEEIINYARQNNSNNRPLLVKAPYFQ